MRHLVLGGSGFIGSHLVDALLACGDLVRVYDRSPERFRAAPVGVEFVAGSLDETALLAEALADVDQVFHLVSTTVPATSNLDPVADIQGNLMATVRLLEMMRAEGVRRLVFLSSGGTVYGIPEVTPIPESHPLRPISSYGIVKIAIENYLMMERHLHGLRPVVLRASNPYGPRQSHKGVQGVIGTFLWRVARNEPIHLWGDGSVVRDFIQVGDLAQLCLAAAASPYEGILNAGSGAGHSIHEVVDTIARVTGRDLAPVYRPGRGFDVPKVVLDIERAREVIGWQPRVALEAGIAETWDWVQRQSATS